MNCLISVYRIIIKIIHDFFLFSPINPSIIRLPIGITSRKRCFPKGNKLEPTPRQGCFMVCCSFRPLEVRRHLVNALPKGAVNLVPLRTSTSGSVSEVQHTIKPLLYVLQSIRLRNLRNLHKLKHKHYNSEILQYIHHLSH